MHKAKILLILIFTGSCLCAQNNTDSIVKSKVGLSLIPPLLVTDKIILDIPTGIRNDGNLSKNFQVSFYLVEENTVKLFLDYKKYLMDLEMEMEASRKNP